MQWNSPNIRDGLVNLRFMLKEIAGFNQDIFFRRLRFEDIDDAFVIIIPTDQMCIVIVDLTST
jgi:hypothetical protein